MIIAIAATPPWAELLSAIQKQNTPRWVQGKSCAHTPWARQVPKLSAHGSDTGRCSLLGVNSAIRTQSAPRGHPGVICAAPEKCTFLTCTMCVLLRAPVSVCCGWWRCKAQDYRFLIPEQQCPRCHFASKVSTHFSQLASQLQILFFKASNTS